LSAQAMYRAFPRSPFPEATAFLSTTAADGDLVLHSNKLSYFPMDVYAPDLRQVFLTDIPGSHNDTLAPATQQALELTAQDDVQRAVDGARRVRFVIFQRELDEYALTPTKMPPALKWLSQSARESGRTAFNDLWVYDFAFDR
ncbi:MAG TPA: hypothetical protein VK449_02200, partial [Anaerolineales bacterium]|nr:hypothetical protein [Anaerolineales bacterium]